MVDFESNPDNYPYKDRDDWNVVPVYPEVEYPSNDEDIVAVCREIHHASDTATAMKPKFQDLHAFFEEQYQLCYKTGQGIDISPLSLDYVFQEFAIKRDAQLGRNGFNTFGAYVLSYLDGMSTVGDGFERYFQSMDYTGKQGRDPHTALLLGCSSISTAQEFTDFVKALDPDAKAIVTDINPLAVKLANEVEDAQAVVSDAQRIPLQDKSVDFIATNFLVQNLVDVEGSKEKTIVNLLKEIRRVLTDNGRFVMVEQLTRSQLEALSDAAYYDAGLTVSTGGPKGGMNQKARVLATRAQITEVMSEVQEFVKTGEAYTGNLLSKKYDTKEAPITKASCLIFEKRH